MKAKDLVLTHELVDGAITARDYIAIQAMNGELASQNGELGEWLKDNYGQLAKNCYGIADAMIKESRK